MRSGIGFASQVESHEEDINRSTNALSQVLSPRELWGRSGRRCFNFAVQPEDDTGMNNLRPLTDVEMMEVKGKLVMTPKSKLKVFENGLKDINYSCAPPGSGQLAIYAEELHKLNLLTTLTEFPELEGRLPRVIISLKRAGKRIDKKDEISLEEFIEMRGDKDVHRCLLLTKTSHALGRIIENLDIQDSSVHDKGALVFVKSSKDFFNPYLEERAITVCQAIPCAKSGHLAKIVCCSITAFNEMGSELQKKLDPLQIYFLEASSISVDELIDVASRCDMGHLQYLNVRGDEYRYPCLGSSIVTKAKSVLEWSKGFSKCNNHKVSVDINVPTTDIISRRLYGDKYQVTAERRELYKLNKPPFCLVVDCSDGYEKKGKKGVITTTKGYIRGGSILDNIRIATKCAKIYFDHGLSVTILTFHNICRLAILAKCREIGLPESFCNDFKISTVEEYQSGKDDYVILVVDRDDLGVTDLRCQNVAVTRCRKHLTLVCNSKMMQASFQDSILGDFYQHKMSQYIPASNLLDASSKEIIDLVVPPAAAAAADAATVKSDGKTITK